MATLQPIPAPSHIQDITGTRVGKLVVLGFTYMVESGRTRPAWICRCDCGNVVVRPKKYLTPNPNRSCKRCYWDLKGDDLAAWLRDTIVDNVTLTTSGCWEWNKHRLPAGYGSFSYRGQTHYAHIVSHNVFIHPIPAGQFSLHKCDNPPCCNPFHLFCGTAADNLKDMVEKGRQQKGERHYAPKLTVEQVQEIRELCRNKICTQREIAKRFGISYAGVSLIKSGKTWKD